jgi:hypothetical protein
VPARAKNVTHLPQQLGHRFRPRNDWEKVRILTPAWDNMLVEVFLNPSARNLSLVNAHIEAVCT